MHRITAWRHYNADTLPPELQPKKVGNIIYVLANPDTPPGRTAGYARVSSAEQKPHLQNQANRLWAHAGQNRIPMDEVVSEIASGLNDKQSQTQETIGRSRRPHHSRGTPGPAGQIRRPAWWRQCSKPEAAP